MRTNVNELSGAALDWAVAKASGLEKVKIESIRLVDGVNHPPFVILSNEHFYSPETDWSQGGPLIESFKIWLTPPVQDAAEPYGWDAEIYSADGNNSTLIVACETPLIAACRAVVAFTVGDTIDIPDELGGAPQ